VPLVVQLSVLFHTVHLQVHLLEMMKSTTTMIVVRLVKRLDFTIFLQRQEVQYIKQDKMKGEKYE
jgi:hypothetical protein